MLTTINKRFIFIIVLLFSLTKSFAQNESKEFGSFEFQTFYERINSYFNSGELVKAQQELDEYSKIRFKTLDCNQKALFYNLQGSIFYSKENDIQALRFWRDSSLTYWTNCPNKSEYHFALIQANIGNSYSYLNELEKASVYLKKATLLWSEIDDLDKTWHAGKLLDNAKFYTQIGDGFNAELLYDRIENILPNLENKEVEAKFMKMKSLHNFTLDRFEEAIEMGNKAISFYNKDEGNYFRDLLICHYNIANSYIDLSNYENSMFHLNKMNALFDKYGKNENYEKYLNLKSIVLKRQGKYTASKEILYRKIRLLEAESPQNLRELAYSYENLADVFLEEEHFEKANSLYKQARNLYVPKQISFEEALKSEIEVFQYPLNLIVCLSQMAKSKNKEYGLTNDVKLLNEANTIYEQIEVVFRRNRLNSYNEVKKAYASDKVKKVYQGAVETYFSLFNKTKNDTYLEKCYKYATLNKSLLQKERARNNKVFHAYVEDSIIEKEIKLTTQINKTHRLLQSEENILSKDSLFEKLSQYQLKYEEYLVNIEKNYPKYFTELYAPTTSLSIREVQKELKGGELFLEYYFGKDSLYIFGIQDSRVHLKTFPKTNTFLQLIAQTRQEIEEGKIPRLKLQRLYSILVEPFLGKDNNRIIIIGDEELLKIPFDVFQDKDKYLIENYPICYLFSNTDLQNKVLAKHKEFKYIGFGTSYSDELNTVLAGLISKDFLPLGNLSQATEEVNISNSILNGNKFLDEAATKSAFIKNCSKASVLHLAVHGIINQKYPDQSAILFDDRTESKLLNLNEIYQLNLNADLVILSSCDSGSGKLFKAEGTQSLARGFSIAGTKSVVSSLWAAYDEPTSKIIANFNKHIKNGDEKDIALQKAKIEYLESAFPTKKAPVYWANLSLIGDRGQIKVDHTVPFYWYLIGGLILLILFLLYKKIKK